MPPRSPTDLSGLVDDVRSLRRTLETDLTIAAAAMEQDAPELAADIVMADRGELSTFLTSLTDRFARLQAAEAAGTPAPSPEVVVPAQRASRLERLARSRLLPVAPLAAALAAAAVIAAGVVQPPTGGRVSAGQIQPVAASWTAFAAATRHDTNAAAVIAAANRLQASLTQLLIEAGHNPTVARGALRLVQLEQLLLEQTHPSGMVVALEESQQLAAQLLVAAGLPAPPALPVAQATIPTTASQVQHLWLPVPTPTSTAPARTTRTTKPTTPTSPAAPTPSSRPARSTSPTPAPTPTPTGFPFPSPRPNTFSG